MKIKKLVIVLLLILLISGISGYMLSQRGIEQQKEPKKLRYCVEDIECIKVSDGCCGCGGGGLATVINKRYHNYWEQKIFRECKEIACLAVISKHWTCFSEPKCIDNQCELIGREEFQNI